MIKKSTFLILLFFALNSFAQKNNISPYSFFGIGETTASKSVSEENMGGIGGAQNSLYQLHFTNPASYASLRLTTYAVAGNNKYLSVDDGNEKQSTSKFNLSYLALGFPIGNKTGVVFGIQPNSKVGYSILNDVSTTESNLFFGEGGTNRVFLGFGHKLPFNTNIGVEASYNFGRIERKIVNRRNHDDDTAVYYASMYQTTSNVNGFSFKLGLQNSTKINEKLDLKTGLTFHLENDLKMKGNERAFSIINLSNSNIYFDNNFIDSNMIDITVDSDFNNKFNTPLKTIINAGIGHGNKWFVGAEYNFQEAVFFKGNVLESPNIAFLKSSKIAIGGFYIPKAESLTNYWQRITYRAGFYSKQLGLKINNTEIKDFGMSFGLTLPSKRKLSNINLGFDIGKRGEVGSGLIQENYFNFRLSLSFTDKWFKKRKLN